MVTLLDLTNNYARQTFALSDVPLGVAFGLDGNALIVTASSFQLFNPSTGSIRLLQTIAQTATNAIPLAPPTFPPNITQATITTSRDGLTIAGFGGASPYLLFRYSVATKTINAGSRLRPAGGPRVVSLSDDGSLMTMAWWLSDANFVRLAEFLHPSGLAEHRQPRDRFLAQPGICSGSHGDGSTSGTSSSTPILQILDSDNLNVVSRIQLPENLAGKSILTSDHNTMYSISDQRDDGVAGGKSEQVSASDRLRRRRRFPRQFLQPKLADADLHDLPIRAATTRVCDLAGVTGISVSPASGITPAVITVAIDPNAFAGQTGTAQPLDHHLGHRDRCTADRARADQFAAARPARHLHRIPGTWSDIVADPKRPAYYVAAPGQEPGPGIQPGEQHPTRRCAPAPSRPPWPSPWTSSICWWAATGPTS